MISTGAVIFLAYLFAHFRELLTPDGEQIYFGISKDGFHWERTNGGKPVLTSNIGEKGMRDIEIARLKDGSFVIVTTDLCIARRWNEKYEVDWKDCNHNGSKKLIIWKSGDLVHFEGPGFIDFSAENYGCLWAPEITYIEEDDNYLLHWGSTVKDDGFNHMSIYCCTTEDFNTFSPPKLFFTKDCEILDSHLVKAGGVYHLFYKNCNPGMNMHETAPAAYGPFNHDSEFDSFMQSLGNPGAYEGGTSYILPDGRWCVLFDFFGCEKEKMGYVPFVSSAPGDARIKMSKEEFSFPYGFKHGGVIEITDEEFDRIRDYYG